jgi:DNA-binding response OmpR family regulator
MRILVVEDETEFADSLRRGLSAEGYIVDTAHDGFVGLQFALTGVYSVIVLDLMLPMLNGYKVCERLRLAGVRTPVLILTAKDGDYDQTDALDGGADDFLSKPFSYPVLLSRLRALVRRASAEPLSQDLTIGDLALDTRRHRCHRDHIEIILTPREFAVLEVLARRPGETVSKQEILLQAWPGEAEDVNLVEARVSALRRKIDEPFGRETLRTVRGIGYRMVDDR